MARRGRKGITNTSRLRRVSPEIERRGIAAWLASAADLPLRVLCAPVGCGKTIAVRQYVERSRGGAAYVLVSAGTDPATLRALVAQIDAEEVVLDEIDRAEAAAAALVEDVHDGVVPRRLVFVGRSRRRMRVHALLARGIAKTCDPAAFAFDAREVGVLADATGVRYEQDDLARVLEETEGWPFAVQRLLDESLAAGCSLAEALTRRDGRDGEPLLEHLRDEGYADVDAVRTFRRIVSEGWQDAQHELERLDQLGLPIVREQGALRPYRVFARTIARDEPASPAQHNGLMTLRIFGRFSCEIDGRPVAFARRRDQQLIAYVALAPEGRTTREELLDAFWPGVDHTVASQGLRIALSRIRRAIDEAAPGIGHVRYLRSAGEVAIDTSVVRADVRRFVDHVERGRRDDERGNVEGAKRHYRDAHELYAGRLLAAEGPEPCLEEHAAELESRYVDVLGRLTSLFAATGELDVARGYARELMACNTEDARHRAFSLFTGAAAAETA
jgi:DNA-binding SARP family transcriptional activator